MSPHLPLLSLLLATACVSDKASEPAWPFPDDFIWGVATSAFQIEGGSVNDWTAWIEEGGAPPVGEAVDGWRRWEEDLDLTAGLGVGIYRFSLEWARLEVEDGVWDEAAFDHYRGVAEGARARGLEPMLTLHHYTNPTWFAEGGSWTRDDAVSQFRDFATKVGEELGGVVDLYNPSNEPVLYAAGCKLAAIYPDGAFNDEAAFRAMYRNLLFGHAAAATALRASDTEDADGDGEAVSIYAVTAAWPVWPADPTSAADLAAAERYDWAYNMAFPHALVTGELDLDLDGDFDGTESGEAEGYVPELANTLDVIGLNYYSRTFVVALEASPLGGIPCLAGIVCGTPGPVAGDNGSEVYPEGLYDVISTFSSLGLPLFITENGVADDDDDLRPAFLATHLREAARAIADGYPLGGYLHWSLLDNYEWRHGFAMKFGLYEVDLETMARRPRPDSVAVFREIVETNSVTTEMLDSWPLPEHH